MARGSRVGPTGQQVARNVERRRRERRLTLEKLSRALDAMRRPMVPSTLSRIETGKRPVDVDDLVCLAYLLDTTPNVLLFEASDAAIWEVHFTPGGDPPASDVVYRWARGDAPLMEAENEQNLLEWQAANRPRNLRGSVSFGELERFARECEELVDEARALVDEGVPREVVIGMVSAAVQRPMPRERLRRKREK